MTFSRVNPIGWGNGEVLTSTQMNDLDTNVTKAVDGAAGGTYTLSAPLALNGSNVSVGADFSVGDDLVVADDASVGGDLTCVGTVAGGIVNTEDLRAPSHVSFSGGPGWDGAHTIDPDDDKVFIFVDDSDISNNRTYDIATTWRNGSFFIINNKSSYTITVNRPSGGSVTIATNKGCLFFKERDIWRDIVMSPT